MSLFTFPAFQGIELDLMYIFVKSSTKVKESEEERSPGRRTVMDGFSINFHALLCLDYNEAKIVNVYDRVQSL